MKKLVRCWVPDEVISDALGLEKLLFIMKQIGNNLYIYTSFYDHFLTFFFLHTMLLEACFPGHFGRLVPSVVKSASMSVDVKVEA